MSEGNTCSRCGKPAQYVETERHGSRVCGDCVHYDAGGDMGERFGAAKMFMVVAQAARESGLHKSDLHAPVTRALRDDEGTAEVDVPWLYSIEQPRFELFKAVKPLAEEVG